MNLFFWMLLNLGVPIIGPIFTLALVAPAHGWRVGGDYVCNPTHAPEFYFLDSAASILGSLLEEELMNKLLMSLGSEKSHTRIVTGATVVVIVVFVSMMVVLLTDILK